MSFGRAGTFCIELLTILFIIFDLLPTRVKAVQERLRVVKANENFEIEELFRSPYRRGNKRANFKILIIFDYPGLSRSYVACTLVFIVVYVGFKVEVN